MAQTPRTPTTDAEQIDDRPECRPDVIAKGCEGPPPTPWLSWKHCFRVYEFRELLLPGRSEVAEVSRDRIRVRARFEHAFCPMGRKQGPIVHSMTLLPQEQIKIYEYDRFRRITSIEERVSQRTSLYSFVSRVAERFADTKTSSGTSFSTTVSSAASGSTGIDLGIVSAGGSASVSTSAAAAGHFNVDSVFQSFDQLVQTASQAVESERSVVVSTFTESESVDSSARTLRNDNQCRAVTYFIRRVFEVYCLTTRLVGIEVQIGDSWVDLAALPAAARDAIVKELGPIKVGQTAARTDEIALPTDGLLFEAELAHCSSCEPERERRHELELKKLELELELIARENERRTALLAAGTLTPFEPCCSEEQDDDEDAPAA